MSRVPGRRQPRPPAGGGQQAQGSEGRLSPPPGSPVPARPASTSHTPRAVGPALYKMGNPLGNSPNSPANRSYCYYTHFRDGQTDPEATQRRVTAGKRLNPGLKPGSGLQSPVSSPQPVGRLQRAHLPRSQRQAVLLSGCPGPERGLTNPHWKAQKKPWARGDFSCVFRQKETRT